MEVLKLAPQEYVDNFYGDVKAEIKKLDKDCLLYTSRCV